VAASAYDDGSTLLCRPRIGTTCSLGAAEPPTRLRRRAATDELDGGSGDDASPAATAIDRLLGVTGTDTLDGGHVNDALVTGFDGATPGSAGAGGQHFLELSRASATKPGCGTAATATIVADRLTPARSGGYCSGGARPRLLSGRHAGNDGSDGGPGHDVLFRAVLSVSWDCSAVGGSDGLTDTDRRCRLSHDLRRRGR